MQAPQTCTLPSTWHPIQEYLGVLGTIRIFDDDSQWHGIIVIILPILTTDGET